MIIGVPKEIKNSENRVSATPAGVFELVHHGHTVLVEKGAGLGSSITDEEYVKAGATMIGSAKEIWASSDLIYKVKEPLEAEYDLIREGQIIFTYMHLAPDPEQTKAVLAKKAIGIAYETVQLANGSLPLLTPMSQVAGRMAVQVGATFLQSYYGGSGTLLGGVPGVAPGEVVIIGGGIVGYNSAKIAVGMGAHVTILDLNAARLEELDQIFDGRVTTLISNQYNRFAATAKADLLISGVLIPGAKAPQVVSEEMVKGMKKGSVIVDIAIDQGGSIETCNVCTTHSNPTYEKYGVIHYTVPNMPGAVPHTSTYALSAVTLPYLLKIADLGPEEACKKDPALMKGLNLYKGQVTCKGVAEAHGLPYADPSLILQ